MEPDDNLSMYVIILIVLILYNALLSMSDSAIVTMSDSKIRKLAQDGDPKGRLLARMIDEPSRFLASIQVGVTLCGFFASAVAAGAFSGRIAAFLLALVPLPPDFVRVVALLLVAFAFGFLALVFGQLLPKRLGMQYCEKIAMAVVRPVALIFAFEKPFVTLLSGCTNTLLRLVGIDPDQRPERVTEEEIRMMIDAGNESGNIEEDEKDMLNNIFEFDDRTAVEMMTHRTEIVAVERDATLAEVVGAARETGYSRIPVYEDDLDNIVGILYVKDLLSLVLESPDGEFQLANYLREPLYVMERTSGKSLLEEFQMKKIQLAVVVDEYGGTSGIVTMEDLIESIVGNIQDEYDDEEEEIRLIGEDLYELDALADLEHVTKMFGLVLDEEEVEFETIGGYIIHKIGYIPTEGEHPSVTVSDVRFTVLRMDERRIDKLTAEVLRGAGTVAEEQASAAEQG